MINSSAAKDLLHIFDSTDGNATLVLGDEEKEFRMATCLNN